MKKLLRFKILTAFFIVSALAGYGQNYETSKTINKTLNVPESVNIKFDNQSADLTFIIASGNSVTVRTEIKVKGRTQEDADALVEALENFEFDLKGNVLDINTRFYKRMQTINGRSTITLLNNDKIKVRNFEIKHEIEIPAYSNLKLANKYSDIHLPAIKGEADFTLYSTKLYAKDFGGNVKIESKYSKLFAETFHSDLDLDFYDTDIKFETCQDLKVNSKYSKIETGKAGNVQIESYDDKFFIDEMAALKVNAKYSDFFCKSELNRLNMEFYDCNLEVKSANQVTFNGKYSDLKLGEVENFKSDDIYDSDIYFRSLNKLTLGKIRYSKIESTSIGGFSVDDSYDDDFLLGKLNKDFNGIKINGKYSKLDVESGNVPFQLDFKIKYAKLDLPENLKTIKHIEKSSDLELIANDEGGKISIEGYDMKVVIR